MKTRIYTDGACSGNPGPGGWAAVILFSEDRQEISGYEAETTNNRMELKAVVEGLRLAIKLGCRKVEINSDSAYVVNAFNKGWLKKWCRNNWKTVTGNDVKNKDLWSILLKLFDLSDVQFVKVKGHAGESNNERVDKLARKEIERAR